MQQIRQVSDEVVTAFGRLGRWFASEDEFGIVPDIITCAKGISSGYLPLGATIFSDEIYDVTSAPNFDFFFEIRKKLCHRQLWQEVEVGITRE